MSAAPAEGRSVDEAFADDYARTFDDFMRHMERQGIPASDRMLEAAHDRAVEKATASARARGYRWVDFAPMARAGLARSRFRYGY
jgi:hypothetical protein